jgi:prepilin-type N-terminal cleavage/methylation domain-containing protein
VGRDVSDIKNRRGMTLVEVMLAATIMGIMSIVVIHALFYPRLLAVSNALRQEAILAGTDALEQIFSQPYNFATPPVNPVGKYVVNGRAITSVITTVDREGTPEYKRITVTVSYPGGGTPIVLETFRCNVN